ncbi:MULTISPECIES: DUF58 domain-containing protein [Pirellulaceae]|uniref:Uncharacterized protein (DUF58 family) n=1 Tax=Aporhodopirellula rubra TaxID=980271 RepID=A0A7W5DW41_9BACT|nr:MULTISPECIES: DUF58 domain-containing protein [Pirellulaceae]EMI44744.1 hypothetical protein RRSWK_02810 [Rhodopirellula sp. SWK7]MBB3205264.1 uncharacterized protein (DUF58 family) [Aporhodopirellula rubra]
MWTSQKPRDFIDPTVLASLAGMPLMARRPMRGTVSGRHTSPTRGSSVEFAQYRKYVPGDDLRRLDWRAHGRSDRYYVKEFEADTNLRCCLVVDTSGSMEFGTVAEKTSDALTKKVITKLQYARRIAAAIGYIAVGQGDAVGLSCVADGIVKHLPALRNPSHLRSIFDTLEEAKGDGQTQLVEVLHELAETTRQGAMILVMSDFFVDPDQLRGCFEHIRFRKHDLSLFHLLDPQELNFSFGRPTRFLDMEGGTAIFAEPSEIADRYQSALREYLDRMSEIVTQTGVDYHRVSLDEPYQEVLTRFLTRRATARGVR